MVEALDYGGVVFEDNKPSTLAEAMAALEKGLRKWFKEQEIEVEPSTDARNERKESSPCLNSHARCPRS